MSAENSSKIAKVVVLGSGIAGLTAANNLIKHGFDVTLVEAKEHIGGRIRTEQHGI